MEDKEKQLIEFEEKLTPDAIYILRKADILIDKIEKGISLGMVSLCGLADEEKVRESRNRYNGIGELTNHEFIRLLQQKKK